MKFGIRGHCFAFVIHWLVLNWCSLIFHFIGEQYFCALPIFSAGGVQRIGKNSLGWKFQERLQGRDENWI